MGGMRAVLMAALVMCGGAARVPGQAAPDSVRQRLLHRYANADDWDNLLRERAVAPQLRQLLGDDLDHLLRNLDVAGPVDLVGGFLAVEGNAPHQGGEEEAVACVGLYDLSVDAAILSDSTIRIYSRDSTYEYLPRCIKDWVTQANSGHRDRFFRPANVVLQRPGHAQEGEERPRRPKPQARR